MTLSTWELETIKNEVAEVREFYRQRLDADIPPLQEEMSRLKRAVGDIVERQRESDRQALLARYGGGAGSTGRVRVPFGKYRGMDELDLACVSSVSRAQQREPGDASVGALEDWQANLKAAMDSTTTSRGDELVATGEASALWADVNLETHVAALFPPGAEERHRRGVHWGQLAALPHPLHGQPAHPSAQACPTWRGHHGPHHLPATVFRRGPRPARPSSGTTSGALSPGGGAAGGRRAGHPGLHGLPSGPLAEAVVQQPAGTAEPGDKAPESLPPKGDVVGIFPNRLSARRLVGAVLAEQHDEWAEARRYLTIPNAAGNEALPEPNMLDAAA